MGERRESVMDWLVLGFMMRMRMGCFSAMRLDGQGVNSRSTWTGVLVERKRKNVIRALLQEGSITTRCMRMYGRSLNKKLDYLGPSFSSTRGPCSSHSCFVIHMFSLSAIYGVISTSFN